MTAAETQSQVDERFGVSPVLTPQDPNERLLGVFNATAVNELMRLKGAADTAQILGNLTTTISSPERVYWGLYGQRDKARKRMEDNIRRSSGEDIEPGSKEFVPIMAYVVREADKSANSTVIHWPKDTSGQNLTFDDLALSAQREYVSNLAGLDVPVLIDPVSYRILGLQVWEQVVQRVAALSAKIETDLLKAKRLLLTCVHDPYKEIELNRIEMAQLIKDVLMELLIELPRTHGPTHVAAVDDRMASPSPYLGDAVEKDLPVASLARMFPLLEVTDDAVVVGAVRDVLERCLKRTDGLKTRMEDEYHVT